MIGDQLQRRPEAPRYQNPDEPLAGKCLTCGKVVGCLRRDAIIESGGAFGGRSMAPGVWSDLPSTGCPDCGARVFVMPMAEFQKLNRNGSTQTMEIASKRENRI